MSDDRYGSDVRVPQAASLTTNRRRVKTLAITGSSTVHEIRAAPADSECYFTIWHNLATNPVCWHAGNASIPAATAFDWVLPQNTERSYKLAAGETHIALVHAGGIGGAVILYISSD